MKAKFKKVMTGIMALALIAAVSAGGTYAYLTRVTEKRANNFTFAVTKGLNATLTEPEWDGVTGYDYDKKGYPRPLYENSTPEDPVYGYYEKDGVQNPVKYPPEDLNDYKHGKKEWPPDIDPSLKSWVESRTEDITWDDYEQPKTVGGKTPGRIDAQEMIPGKEAAKNPFITNTGTLDEWVAAKVSFVYSDDARAGQVLSSDDFNKVKDVIRIDWPAANAQASSTADNHWHYASEAARLTPDGNDYQCQMVFYYDIPLTTEGDGSQTKPIFTHVKADLAASREQIRQLEQMGGFTIYIEGYAVQKDAFAEGAQWVSVSVKPDAEWRAVFVSDGAEAGDVIANTGGLGITGAGLSD